LNLHSIGRPLEDARERVSPDGTAEGATAPESLRQKDRAFRTLWKAPVVGFAMADHRRGNPPRLRRRRGKLSGSRDRGGIGTIRLLVRSDRYVREPAR